MVRFRARAHRSRLYPFRPLRRLRGAAPRSGLLSGGQARRAVHCARTGSYRSGPGAAVVPAARRRARLKLVRPRDPRLPARVGFRSRFSHDLVDLRKCSVLEPALFALVGELRLVARKLLPAGGTAEVTLTRTDSGVDLLLEAAR